MSFTNQLPFAGIAGAPYGVVVVKTANFMTLLQGNPNGIIAGQSGTSSVPPDMVWDWFGKNLWVCTQSGGTPAATVWSQLAEVGPAVFTTFTAQSGTFTGPVSVGGNMAVTGNETVGGNLTVNGTGASSIAGPLTVPQLTVNGPLSVTGSFTLPAAVGGAANYSGAAKFNAGI